MEFSSAGPRLGVAIVENTIGYILEVAVFMTREAVFSSIPVSQIDWDRLPSWKRDVEMGYVILLWHSLSLPYNYFVMLLDRFDGSESVAPP